MKDTDGQSSRLRQTRTKARARPASIERLVESMDLGIQTLHPGGLRITRELAHLAGIRRESDVLEVACGTGESACLLASEFDCRVHGVDLSADMIARATNKARERGIEAQFQTGGRAHPAV